MLEAATVLTVLLSSAPSLALPSAGCGTELDQGRPNHRYGEVETSIAGTKTIALLVLSLDHNCSFKNANQTARPL